MGIRLLLAVLTVLGAIALFVAGCGGDDDDDTAATTETTTEAAGGGGGGGQTVEMTEFEFDPSELTVSKGDVIEVINNGELPHNMSIEGQDLTTSDLEPGASQQLDLQGGTRGLPAGDYEFICTIDDHAEQGMTGTMTVE